MPVYRKNFKYLVSIFVFCLMLSAALVLANIPYPLQAKFFFTILSHDRNLSTRSDGEVKIGVIGGTGASEITSALQAFTDKKISGMPITVTQLSYSSSSALAGEFTANKISAVYIPSGQGSNISGILSATKKAQVLSFSGEESYASNGVAVVVKMEGSKPKLVINLPTANAEGVNFDSRVLSLAEVIK